MTAHFERPVVRTDGMGAFILGGLIAIAIFLGLMANELIPSVSSTAGDPVMEVIYSHPRMPVSRAIIDNWTPVTMPDGSMPDFPNCSLNVKNWCWSVREGSFEDGHVIETSLKGDGKILADVQYMEMSVEYAEMNGIAHITDNVWLSAVRVARFARLNGLGARMMTAGDRVLAHILGCEGMGCGYHAFFNSSGSQRWMDTMRARVPDAMIIYEDAEMFIYEVLSR